MSTQQERLQSKLNKMRAEYGSAYQMAVGNGLSYGLVYRCLSGGFSPSLARKLGVSKYPPRTRLTISCDKAMITRYDSLRGDVSRRAFMAVLLDSYSGIGEVV